MMIDPIDEAPCRATIADRVPLRTIMARTVICARPDLDVTSLVKLVIQDHLGCIPVVDERQHPIGIITKYDLVEQLDATLQAMARNKPLPAGLAAQTADELMTLENAVSVASLLLLTEATLTEAPGKNEEGATPHGLEDA
jgi:CBS domain-containing protein